jgi:hypothetical protein
MTPDSELHLIKLCAFYPGCVEEINDLHEKVCWYSEASSLEFNAKINFRFKQKGHPCRKKKCGPFGVLKNSAKITIRGNIFELLLCVSHCSEFLHLFLIIHI